MDIGITADRTNSRYMGKFIDMFSRINISLRSKIMISFFTVIILLTVINAVMILEVLRINRVYDDDKLMDEAWALAKNLAAGPTESLRLIRQAYWKSIDNSYEEQLDVERVFQKAAGETEDFREGVTAFIEKRPARFKGR